MDTGIKYFHISIYPVRGSLDQQGLKAGGGLVPFDGGCQCGITAGSDGRASKLGSNKLATSQAVSLAHKALSREII